MAAASATSPTVTFTVAGESTPRTARVTKTNEGYSVEHQYKATLSTGEIITYYANDGVNLSTQTTGTITGWRCNENGITYIGSHISGVNGDIHLAPVYDWKIDVGKPSSATDMGGDVYKITDFTTGFLFEAKVSDGTPIQNVETCSWTVNSTNLSETNTLCTITPSGMGLNAGNIGTNATNATPVTITCNVTVAGAAPQPVTKTIKLYKEPVLPSFNITNSDGTELSITPYVVHSMTETLSFGLSVSNFPSGTQFEWEINGIPLSGQTGASCSINATDMGFTNSTIPTTAATAASVSIACTATHPDVAGDQSTSAAFDIWKEPYSIACPDTSLGLDEVATITVTGATGTPLVTATPPETVNNYFNITDPQQNLSDASIYTINISIKSGDGGLGKVWFGDNSKSISIYVTDPNSGATSQTLFLTFYNKYQYQLKKSDGSNAGSAVNVYSDSTLTFAAAKNAVEDPSGREIVAFKNAAGTIVLREAADPGPTSITFNSDTFSNREITLTAVPIFTYSVKDGDDAALSQNGTQEDPYILKFNGTAAEKTLHVSVPTSEYYGQITTTFETPNILTVNAGTIGIADELTEDAIPGTPVKVTLKDSGTSGTGATQDFYVKIEPPAETPVPAGMVTVTGGTDSSGNAIMNLLVCDHEVTQHEYETYCGWGSTQPESGYGLGTNYPAYYVSWYDAILYCNLRSVAENLDPCYYIGGNPIDASTSGEQGFGSKPCGPSSNNPTWNGVTVDTTKSGYRLPTTAEWEWAANGGVSPAPYTYSGSNNIGAVAWYSGNSGENGDPADNGGKTHPVKGKQYNSLNIYDMSGNVSEWCWDSSSSYRVIRGGSWGHDASDCAVSYRINHSQNDRCNYLGFRVVRKAP